MIFLGHSSNIPCTVCIFYKKKHGNDSLNAHSSDLHSGRLGFYRYDEQVYLIRKSNIAKNKENIIGLKPGSFEVFQFSPITNLSMRLREIFDCISCADNGNVVVSGFFDSYRSNAIAPDHLLSGLSSNILLVALSLIHI